MLITKRSVMTGKLGTMDIDVTDEQLGAWMEGDTLIQVAFPWLSAEEREFLLSGITPDEWADLGFDEEFE